MSVDKLVKLISEIDDPYVRRAFEQAHDVMFTLKEYVNVSGFKVSKYLVDNFFHGVKRRHDVYIDIKRLVYFGYTGEDRKMRQNFKNLLERNFEKGVDYKLMSNVEYQTYYNKKTKGSDILRTYVGTQDCESKDGADPYTIVGTQDCEFKNGADPLNGFPNPNEFINVHGMSSLTHIVLTHDCFKSVMMMLNTKKGKQIRKFYLMLERLIISYTEYQKAFVWYRNIILEATVRKLNEANKCLTREKADIKGRLNLATIDRVPPLKNPMKNGTFVLIKLNDPEHEYEYYVIRSQFEYAIQTIVEMREEYENMKVVVYLKDHPNPINLFNWIKKKLRDGGGLIKVKNNHIRLVNYYTQNQLIYDVRAIDAEKKDV